MSTSREYRRFAHKGANFRICSDRFEAAAAEIVRQREVLEEYLRRHPAFGESFEPVDALPDAPEVARRMARGAAAGGVGPMAAVAGTMAQMAAEAAIAAGAAEAIVENGGDMFLICQRPVIVGLYAGEGPLADHLALRIGPERTPLAICSSSSRMGHSMSLGDCDLATVASADGSLADAAATAAANRVRVAADIDPTLKAIGGIAGVEGVLLVKGDRIGLYGTVGELVANRDPELTVKVTRDPRSGAGG